MYACNIKDCIEVGKDYNTIAYNSTTPRLHVLKTRGERRSAIAREVSVTPVGMGKRKSVQALWKGGAGM